MVTINYGHKPSTKIIDTGIFICPTCQRKRSYEKLKLIKVNYFGVINFPSSKALAKFVMCKGCLNNFPIDVLDPVKQLKIELSSESLPPPTLFDDFTNLSKELKCEEFLAGDPSIQEIDSPVMRTLAHLILLAGNAIRLSEYDKARICLINIFNLLADLELMRNNRFQVNEEWQKKVNGKKREFKLVAHYLLSKLP